MTYLIIYEVERFDFTAVPFLLELVMLGYALLHIDECIDWIIKTFNRKISKVAVLAVIIVVILAMSSLTVLGGWSEKGNLKKAYHSGSYDSIVQEGEVTGLYEDNRFGYFYVNGIQFEFSKCWSQWTSIFENRGVIEHNGQRVRITYLDDEDNQRNMIYKVEMAKEDVPPDKLDKLMKKYGNDKTDE